MDHVWIVMILVAIGAAAVDVRRAVWKSHDLLVKKMENLESRIGQK